MRLDSDAGEAMLRYEVPGDPALPRLEDSSGARCTTNPLRPGVATKLKGDDAVCKDEFTGPSDGISAHPDATVIDRGAVDIHSSI